MSFCCSDFSFLAFSKSLSNLVFSAAVISLLELNILTRVSNVLISVSVSVTGVHDALVIRFSNCAGVTVTAGVDPDAGVANAAALGPNELVDAVCLAVI